VAGGQISLGGWLSALFYGANYYDLWVGYTSSLPNVRHPFNILWSLAIEEHFYLLWPLILGVTWRSAWLPWVLVGFCAAVLVWRALLFDQCFMDHAGWLCAPLRADPRWRYNQLYLSTGARADSIAWGVLLAVGEARGTAWLPGRRASVTGLVALSLLAASFALPGAFGRYVVRASVQGAALLFLVPVLLGRESIVRRALSCPPALAIGRLSYVTYLWHWGALGLADWARPRHGTAWLALAISLTCLLTGLAYFGIEKPMLRVRRRAGSHAPLQLTG
jgi:peptidoglycan/LPS O-acetylase OafA/YrhL